MRGMKADAVDERPQPALGGLIHLYLVQRQPMLVVQCSVKRNSAVSAHGAVQRAQCRGCGAEGAMQCRACGWCVPCAPWQQAHLNV